MRSREVSNGKFVSLPSPTLTIVSYLILKKPFKRDFHFGSVTSERENSSVVSSLRWIFYASTT